MTTLIIGLILFFGVHLIPLTPLKAGLVARFGENAYKGLFSLAAALGLIAIVWGFAMTRYGPVAANMVYWPPDWARHVTMALVLLAFIAFGVYLHKGRLKIWLRHPMSIAIALWAIGHLLANGDIGSVLLFGSFLAYALIDIVVGTARGRVPSFTPKPSHDLIAVAAGLVMYVAVLYLHPFLFGATVVNW